MSENKSSFANRFAKKSNMSQSKLETENNKEITADPSENNSEKKPIDPQKRALAQYIYLVKGVDAGRNAWYYVLVEKLKVQLFLKALNDDIIHLEKYGKILYSGYGDEPPSSVTKLIKEEYGIS